MSRTQKHLNHFFFFPIMPCFSVVLILFSGFLYLLQISFTHNHHHHLPSFLFSPYLINPTSCLPLKFPEVCFRSLRKSDENQGENIWFRNPEGGCCLSAHCNLELGWCVSDNLTHHLKSFMISV